MKRPRAGNSGLEFTLAGIPVIFVLISTMEMARAMWTYNALGHCTREAARYASRKGENCSSGGNDCATTVSEIVGRIRGSAFGVAPAELDVTLTSTLGTRTCTPVDVCLDDESMWPPAGGNTVGAEITVTASHRFHSAIAMLWPGAGVAERSSIYVLQASSTERIGF
jgi:Flp pilus assembly protein TadG